MDVLECINRQYMFRPDRADVQDKFSHFPQAQRTFTLCKQLRPRLIVVLLVVFICYDFQFAVESPSVLTAEKQFNCSLC